jgi:hypothetical protein
MREKVGSNLFNKRAQSIPHLVANVGVLFQGLKASASGSNAAEITRSGAGGAVEIERLDRRRALAVHAEAAWLDGKRRW